MTRQGIENGKPAIELAQKVASSKRMEFQGFMAYSGNAAHTKTWPARRARSAADLAGVRETVDLARKAGLPVSIVSGGSTGYYKNEPHKRVNAIQARGVVVPAQRTT